MPAKKKAVQKPKKMVSRNLVSALKVGAWCGIGGIAFSFVSGMISTIYPGVTDILVSIISLVLSIAFIYGFVALGRIYKNNLIQGVAIAAIVMQLVSFAGTIYAAYYIEENIDDFAVFEDGIVSDDMSEDEAWEYFKNAFETVWPTLKPLAIGLAIFLAISLVLGIMWGVGLIQIGKDVEYAKVAGILTLVGIFTIPIIVGIFLLIAVFIMELVILFNESSKLSQK